MENPGLPATASQGDGAQTLADAECPHCGTMLRRVTTGTDGKVLCLNCGKRHSLRTSESTTPPGDEASLELRSGTAAQPQIREPVAPAYGYLRALGILALVAGVVGTFFACLGVYMATGATYFSWSAEYVWFFQNSFSPAIVGWWLFALTDALVRLDAAHTALAWRRGYFKEAILAPKGSSLPYILPLAATGGVLGFSVAFANADSRGDVDLIPMLIGFLLIGASMAAGFAIENLRLFFFRQAELARMAASAAHGKPLYGKGGALVWSGSALWMVGMAAFFSIGMLAILFEDRMRGHEALMMILGICGLASIGYSLTLVLGGLADAREEWLRAARSKPGSTPDLLAWVGTGAPILLLCIGAVFVLALFVAEGHIRTGEFFVFFGFSAGLACFAMFLLTLFRAVRSWQVAHSGFLSKGSERTRPGGRVRTLIFVLLLISVANLCAGAVTVSKAMSSWGNWYSLSQIVTMISGLALFVLATAYLPLWLACMVREARVSLESAEEELARKKMEADAVYPPPEE
ncbi:MAG: hypothetical protein HY291_07965 [Planctomycetes bacterium]|nr:hypothetical protein [Planctomycetota bacterium]